jgi:hypothetical protein
VRRDVIVVVLVVVAAIAWYRRSVAEGDAEERSSGETRETSRAAKSAPSSPPNVAYRPALPTPNAPAPQPALAVSDMRDRMERQFAAQPSGGGVAADGLQRARDRLPAALPPGSSLRSLDCRATLCRIETTHPDLQHYRQYLERAFRDGDTELWNGGMMTAIVEEANDGALLTVAFLAYDGQGLPAWE